VAHSVAVQVETDGRAGSVLVVHPDRKAQRALHRVLAATLRPVEIVEVAELEARVAPDVVVVVDQQTAEAHPTLVELPARAWIAVPGDDVGARPEVVAQLLDAGWRHVIGTPLQLSADELVVTAQKLLREDLFGLEKYVGWAATVRTIYLEDATDRSSVVGALVDGVGLAGLSERVASLASVIADELLANAIYAAPIQPDGRRPFHGAPRDQARPLIGRHAVRLRWASDSRHLAVEVADVWGSLDVTAPGPLIARSARRAGRLSGDDPGMGLALAYACCHQLVLGVAPGKRTEAIALIDVRHRPADIGRSPSFHVFVEREAA